MADVLILAPHPDDAEIHCGATIASLVRQNRSVVIVDLTRGELGSRGDASTRLAEAAEAARILGVTTRENLALQDAGVPAQDPHARLLVVDAIRRHRPRTILCLNGLARHPDHICGAQLVQGAVKAAAFHKLATPSGAQTIVGVRLFFFEAELPISPSFLVPCGEYDWKRKMEAVRCYGSQLLRRGDDDGPATSISDPAFIAWIESRGRAWGYQAGAPFAEAFLAPEPLRLTDLAGI